MQTRWALPGGIHLDSYGSTVLEVIETVKRVCGVDLKVEFVGATAR